MKLPDDQASSGDGFFKQPQRQVENSGAWFKMGKKGKKIQHPTQTPYADVVKYGKAAHVPGLGGSAGKLYQYDLVIYKI